MGVFARMSHRLALILFRLVVLSSLVAAVWLGYHEQWTLLAGSAAAMFLGALLIAVAMLPDFIFSAPATMMNAKGYKTGFWFFSFLSDLYGIAVLSAWCIGVFYVFKLNTPAELWVPGMLLAWGTASIPIAWMEMRDDLEDGKSAEYSMSSSFFAQLAAAFMMFVMALGFPLFNTGIKAFAIVMVLAVIFEFRTTMRDEALGVGEHQDTGSDISHGSR